MPRRTEPTISEADARARIALADAIDTYYRHTFDTAASLNWDCAHNIVEYVHASLIEHEQHHTAN